MAEPAVLTAPGDATVLAACKDVATHVVGQRCDACGSVAGGDYVPWDIQTWDAYDAYHAAHEASEAADEVLGVFDTLRARIMDDPTTTAREKAARMTTLTSGLEDRISVAMQDEMGERALTKRVDGADLSRGDFADQGDASNPSTWKLPLTTAAGGTPDAGRVRDAITALQPGGFRGNPVKLTSPRGAVVGRIRSAIGKLDVPSERKDALRQRLSATKAMGGDPGGIQFFKDAAGDTRWVTIYTNNFKDRVRETFSAAAHQEYAAYVERTKDYPVLRLWHIPADIGDADRVMWDERGFMVASGTLRPEFAYVGARLAAMKGLGCSHGYTYAPADLQDGVYTRYRTFEISVLPVADAANLLTAAAIEEDMDMGKAEEFFKDVLGPDRAAALDGAVDVLATRAHNDGVSFKDMADAAGAVADPATAPGADASAVATPAADPAAAAADPAPDADKPADGATPDPDAMPDGALPTSADATKAFKDMLTEVLTAQGEKQAAAITAAVQPLITRLDAQDAQIAALGGSKDAAVAAAIAPRIGPIGAVPASQSDATVVPDGVAAAIKAAQSADGAKDAPAHPADKYVSALAGLPPVVAQ